MQTAPSQEQLEHVNHPRSLALTAAELRSFQTNGYIGPFQLVEPRLCGPLAERLVAKVQSHPVLNMRSPRRRIEDSIHAFAHRYLKREPIEERPAGTPRYWYKSAHLLIPEVEELALRPGVIDRMTSILGKDLLLWGGQLVAKRAGEHHRWHEDVEHVAWAGVTAWIGLSNVDRHSTMKIIPGSHLFGVTPQELAKRHGGRLESNSDVLRLAKQISPDARIVELDLRPGDFFIFSGRTWHASKNDTGRERVAMIFQFCPSSSRARIPCSYELPTPWYPAQPWVMLASGEDHHHINHVQRPRALRRPVSAGE
jgi:phytanoyl-CoA dioxygenase PhyH